jgi:hypothetical protein
MQSQRQRKKGDKVGDKGQELVCGRVLTCNQYW